MTSSKIAGLCAGIGITLTWSLWILATRLGLKTDIGVYDLLALRFMMACMVLVPVVLYLGSWRGLSAKRYIILAILGGLPQNILTYEAIERSPVALVSVFMYGTTPIVTALVTYLFLKKKMTIDQVLGTAVIFGGILLMSGNPFAGAMDMDVWSGNAMAVLAILSFATFIVYTERWEITVSQGLVACTVLNGMIYLPVWFFFSENSLAVIPAGEIAFQAGLQGLVPGLFAMLITTFAARTIGAGAVSLFYSMIPACAATLAVPILGEGMNLLQVLGLVVASLGILMASTQSKAFLKQRFART